jgi:hypothetical protein
VQPPQLFGSLATLVQAPGFVPQMISPAGQFPHTLAAHDSPVAQAWPHAPQLLGSVVSLTQAPWPAPAVPEGQSVSPVGQTQWPEMHAAPWSQMKPHAPQLFGSFVVSTQPALHAVSPVLQTQAGADPPGVAQMLPAGQTLPHVPQLKSSVRVLVHTPGLFPLLPQTVGLVGGQLQAPAAHMPPLGQTVPHALQSVTLVCRFWQPSGHAVVPVGHPQTPLVHTAPGPWGHFMPHWLQLAGSVLTLVQTFPQMLLIPVGHVHVPLMHDPPCGHALPHVPQLVSSVSVSVQAPLQRSGVGAKQVTAPSRPPESPVGAPSLPAEPSVEPSEPSAPVEPSLPVGPSLPVVLSTGDEPSSPIEPSAEPVASLPIPPSDASPTPALRVTLELPPHPTNPTNPTIASVPSQRPIESLHLVCSSPSALGANFNQYTGASRERHENRGL